MIKMGGRACFELSQYFLGGGSMFFYLFSHLFGEDSHFDEHVFQFGVQPRSSFGYR